MILNIKFICLVLSCLITRSTAPVIVRQLSERIIETRDGSIRGILVEFHQDYKLKTIEAFFSIPYASLKGVRGNVLRFMPPSSLSKWKYVKDTSKQNASMVCPQKWLSESEKVKTNPYQHVRQTERIRKQDEDCLSLNLFVPNQEIQTISDGYQWMFDGCQWMFGCCMFYRNEKRGLKSHIKCQFVFSVGVFYS